MHEKEALKVNEKKVNKKNIKGDIKDILYGNLSQYENKIREHGYNKISQLGNLINSGQDSFMWQNFVKHTGIKIRHSEILFTRLNLLFNVDSKRKMPLY